jgi:hypothetical protein
MKIIHRSLILILFISLCIPLYCKAYSILSHQAIIDAAWKPSILPQLKKKFPSSNDSLLKDAHAFAYGGSVAADMGYFPFGSMVYSNLVHYVRSGDFIEIMLQEATTLNEYAFALGFLSHYNADKYGHAIATNISAPLLYPKVKKKYGNIVTYEEDPTAHVRTEFGFDVLQLARGAYEAQAYRDFIGFQISKELLERAFLKTYALDINEIFGSYSLAIGSFRWAVKNLIPTLTNAAWKTKKKEIQQLQPGITSRQFKYRMNRKTYYKQFGKERYKPGFGASLLSIGVCILPKIGPLKKLKFKVPGPEVEKLYIQSFDTVSYHYGFNIKQAATAKINLANIDFDTGKSTLPGEYNLADETYVDLLLRLYANDFNNVTTGLQQNILKFFTHSSATKLLESNIGEKEKIRKALEELTKYKPEVSTK